MGWLLALLAAQLLVGLTLGRRFCIQCLVYFELIQPRFGEGPLEDSRPPRAANIVGFAFLTAASVAYGFGADVAGAVLGLIVAALALLAAVTGFCTGCEAYKLGCRLTGRPFVSCPLPGAGMTWQFSLAGLLVGILVGMTGMGGGSLMTPILILLFGFNAKVAVGTDILHGAIFKSFGAVRHRMLGTVHARLALWMLAGSAPLSLVGVEVANSVGDSSMTSLQKVVGGALIVGGLGFLVKTFIGGRGRRRALPARAPRQGDRGRDRRELRLRRRADLGRLGDLLRPRDAARLPADRAEDRRHRHVPRRRARSGWPAPRISCTATSTSTRWRGCSSARSPACCSAPRCRSRSPSGRCAIAFGIVLVLSGIKLVGVPQATP